MQPIETIGVLVFVSLVSVVFVHAAIALVRTFRNVKLGPARKFFDRLSMALAAVGALCIAYGYFVEPFRLSVTHVEVPTSKIPASASPIRVVHVSDLHSDPKARLELSLVDAVRAERPDVVVFTGDSINSPEGLPVFKAALTGLARIAPTFAVKGNWDVAYWPELDRFRGTGAHELNGNAERIQIRGTPIWIAGLSAGNEQALDRIAHSVPLDEFVVLLYHYPDLLHEAAALHIDYCAGHTHGGQIALPFYGALITLSRFGKKYEAGLFREEETWMYVNRGIGMEGGLAPRVRFWAPPEISVIEISPAHHG